MSDKKKVTLSGRPAEQEGPAPAPIDEATGQHKDYWILSDEDRAKGFVRPIRRTYTHIKCGTNTSMGIKLAETYAVDPKFYSHTFCCACSDHLPVDEFTWVGTDEKVGA